MGWASRAFDLLDKIDTFLSWWQRLAKLSWVTTGVAAVSFYVFSTWAWLIEQPLIIHVALSLLMATCVTLLFTQLPRLLSKITHTPFEVLVPMIEPAQRRVRMEVSIVNRSPKNNLVLEFLVCVRERDGKQEWFLSPETDGINLNLGPQAKTEGVLTCSLFEKSATVFPTAPNVFLRVTDRISSRRVSIKVPGSYPTNPSGEYVTAGSISQRIAGSKAQPDRDAVRRKQRETITHFIEKGMQIRDTYVSLEPISKAVAQEWETEVYRYLEQTLGRDYAVQFRRPNTHFLPNVRRPEISEKNNEIYLALQLRLARLDEFLKELRN